MLIYAESVFSCAFFVGSGEKVYCYGKS